MGLCMIRSLNKWGPGSTDKKWLLSLEFVASIKLDNFESFVSVVDAGGVEMDDDEPIEGIERSISFVDPKEMISSATLFFFIFFPNYIVVK